MVKIIGAANEKHEKMMRDLAKFTGAKSVEYQDLDKGEEYILKKNGRTLVLHACGNRFDGGFLWVDLTK